MAPSPVTLWLLNTYHGYVAVTLVKVLVVTSPLMKYGRWFGKLLSRIASSCRFPNFRPAPRLMLNVEPVSCALSPLGASILSCSNAPLLAPNAQREPRVHVGLERREQLRRDRLGELQRVAEPRPNRSSC